MFFTTYRRQYKPVATGFHHFVKGLHALLAHHLDGVLRNLFVCAD